MKRSLSREVLKQSFSREALGSGTLSWRQWAVVLGLAAVGITLVAVGLKATPGGAVASRAQEADRRFQELTGALGTHLAARLDRLRSLVQVEELRPLLTGADPERLHEEEERLHAASEDLLGVRLLPEGSWAYDADSTPPLTYATLGMLREAEAQGQAPLPTAQLFGTPKAHIAVLVRVPGEDPTTTAGYVLLGLRPQLVQAGLDALAPDLPQVEVKQFVSGRGSLVVARRGHVEGGRPSVARLPGTAWIVSAITVAPVEGEGMAMSGMMLVGGGLVLVVVALGFAGWQGRRRPTTPAGPVLAGAVARVGETGGRSLGGYLESGPSEEAATPVAAAAGEAPEATAEPAEEEHGVPPAFFRAYDIRGVVEEGLDAELARRIGQAIGSEAQEREQQAIVVGRDGRRTSPELAQALIAGLRASGVDVIDVGQVPTPVLYFAAYHLETESGVMVTGSHNPPEYNGFKIMLGGETLSGAAITAIRERLEAESLRSGEGNLLEMEIGAEYIRRVSEDIPVALGDAFKLVVDCGNGVAGDLAPKLFRALGHDVVELYCEIDGGFPHHHPDPSQPANLADLIRRVREEEADLGLAFDGDGDRIGVVDGEGNLIWPDRVLMLLAGDVLSRNPGASVVFDVKCSHQLAEVVTQAGGNPVMWKSGHSLIKAKMEETGALLGGELTGHIFMRDRWYGFDDALYAGARVLELLQEAGRPPPEVFSALPRTVTTPELHLEVPEEVSRHILTSLEERRVFTRGTLTTIDGLRVDYDDGWGLMRASNTTPSLVFRFEGRDEEAMKRIQEEFRTQVEAVAPGILLPF